MNETPRLRVLGDTGLLLECLDLDDVRRWHRALAADLPSGVLDLVPGAGTLLVRVPPGTDLTALARAVLARAAQADRPPAAGRIAAPPAEPPVDVEVVLPVRYDGADLIAVAERTGLSPAQVVVAHTGTPWQVAFLGFAPGFGYLTGGDPRLHVPRRDHPREQVPAGSVALAGGFSGVYPRASPGGWQLIGRTDAVLWDVSREPAALLRPGVTVWFEPVGIDPAR